VILGDVSEKTRPSSDMSIALPSVPCHQLTNNDQNVINIHIQGRAEAKTDTTLQLVVIEVHSSTFHLAKMGFYPFIRNSTQCVQQPYPVPCLHIP